MGFPSGSVVKNQAANTGDTGSIPGSERYPGEENSSPLQHSCLGNPVDRRAWLAIVHGVSNSRTQLSEANTFLSTPTELRLIKNLSIDMFG